MFELYYSEQDSDIEYFIVKGMLQNLIMNRLNHLNKGYVLILSNLTVLPIRFSCAYHYYYYYYYNCYYYYYNYNYYFEKHCYLQVGGEQSQKIDRN